MKPGLEGNFLGRRMNSRVSASRCENSRSQFYGAGRTIKISAGKGRNFYTSFLGFAPREESTIATHKFSGTRRREWRVERRRQFVSGARWNVFSRRCKFEPRDCIPNCTHEINTPIAPGDSAETLINDEEEKNARPPLRIRLRARLRRQRWKEERVTRDHVERVAQRGMSTSNGRERFPAGERKEHHLPLRFHARSFARSHSTLLSEDR